MRSFRYQVTEWIPIRDTRYSGYSEIVQYIREAVEDNKYEDSNMLLYHPLPVEMDGEPIFWPEYFTKNMIDSKSERTPSFKIGSGCVFKLKPSELRHIYFSEDDIVNRRNDLRREGLAAFIQGYPISHIEYGEMIYIDEDNDEMSEMGVKVFYVYSGEDE